MTMKTRRVRLGRASGLILPKPLAKEAGLEGEVEVRVSKGSVTIRRPGRARKGWAAAFRQMRQHGDDRLLDGDISSLSQWDENEWEW
jgi:antitoxin component of MazEF toxin-antitoxin module